MAKVDRRHDPHMSDITEYLKDSTGNPLVLYHGTRRQFDSFVAMFPRGALGNPKGVYLTTDIEEAIEYAQDVDGAWDEKSRVISVHVRDVGASGYRTQSRTYRGETHQEFAIFDPENIQIVNHNFTIERLSCQHQTPIK